jgi:ubiquinone/menaquinone biosynthesis C-methylase UbiE
LSVRSDQFSAVAEAYAARRPSYPDELFDHLSALCLRTELAWDCGAGSGQASLPLARAFRRVIATDSSRAMLARAVRHERVVYVVATAEACPLDSATADVVTVAQALHWFNPESFYREVERVLAPGGILAVWTYGSQLLDHPAMDRVLTEFYEDTVGPYWASERRHVESGYRSLPFPYPELPAPAWVMERRWSLDDLLGYIGTWSATQLARESTGSDPVMDLRGRMLPLWGDPGTLRRVRWPLNVRVGRRPAT